MREAPTVVDLQDADPDSPGRTALKSTGYSVRFFSIRLRRFYKKNQALITRARMASKPYPARRKRPKLCQPMTYTYSHQTPPCAASMREAPTVVDLQDADPDSPGRTARRTDDIKVLSAAISSCAVGVFSFPPLSLDEQRKGSRRSSRREQAKNQR